MDESVKDATGFGSGSRLADRISQWASEHPEADAYQITTEIEAGELLATIMASIEISLAGVPADDVHAKEVEVVKKLLADMTMARSRNDALGWIREFNKTDQLEFIGLRIEVPAVVMC